MLLKFIEQHYEYKLMLKEFRIQSYLWITFLFFSSSGWRLLSLFLRRWCISAKTTSSWLQPALTSCWVPCSSSRKGYSSRWGSTFLLSPWIQLHYKTITLGILDFFHRSEEQTSVDEFIEDHTQAENNWLFSWNGSSKDLRWKIQSIIFVISVDDICTKFDSQSVQMFNIKVMKVYIVGIVTVVDSIFGFSLNSFDDFDHDKCHMDISFFIISMLDLHKLSQGHLTFVQRSFFFFMAVARGRATHLFNFLLAHNTLRADVTFFFCWSVVSSSRASCSWSWAFDIFWFTHSWFIPRFEGCRSHLVGGF